MILRRMHRRNSNSSSSSSQNYYYLFRLLLLLWILDVTIGLPTTATFQSIFRGRGTIPPTGPVYGSHDTVPDARLTPDGQVLFQKSNSNTNNNNAAGSFLQNPYPTSPFLRLQNLPSILSYFFRPRDQQQPRSPFTIFKQDSRPTLSSSRSTTTPPPPTTTTMTTRQIVSSSTSSLPIIIQTKNHLNYDNETVHVIEAPSAMTVMRKLMNETNGSGGVNGQNQTFTLQTTAAAITTTTSKEDVKTFNFDVTTNKNHFQNDKSILHSVTTGPVLTMMGSISRTNQNDDNSMEATTDSSFNKSLTRSTRQNDVRAEIGRELSDGLTDDELSDLPPLPQVSEEEEEADNKEVDMLQKEVINNNQVSSTTTTTTTTSRPTTTTTLRSTQSPPPTTSTLPPKVPETTARNVIILNSTDTDEFKDLPPLADFGDDGDDDTEVDYREPNLPVIFPEVIPSVASPIPMITTLNEQKNPITSTSTPTEGESIQKPLPVLTQIGEDFGDLPPLPISAEEDTFSSDDNDEDLPKIIRDKFTTTTTTTTTPKPVSTTTTLPVVSTSTTMAESSQKNSSEDSSIEKSDGEDYGDLAPVPLSEEDDYFEVPGGGSINIPSIPSFSSSTSTTTTTTERTTPTPTTTTTTTTTSSSTTTTTTTTTPPPEIISPQYGSVGNTGSELPLPPLPPDEEDEEEDFDNNSDQFQQQLVIDSFVPAPVSTTTTTSTPRPPSSTTTTTATTTRRPSTTSITTRRTTTIRPEESDLIDYEDLQNNNRFTTSTFAPPPPPPPPRRRQRPSNGNNDKNNGNQQLAKEFLNIRDHLQNLLASIVNSGGGGILSSSNPPSPASMAAAVNHFFNIHIGTINLNSGDKSHVIYNHGYDPREGGPNRNAYSNGNNYDSRSKNKIVTGGGEEDDTRPSQSFPVPSSTRDKKGKGGTRPTYSLEPITSPSGGLGQSSNSDLPPMIDVDSFEEDGDTDGVPPAGSNGGRNNNNSPAPGKNKVGGGPPLPLPPVDEDEFGDLPPSYIFSSSGNFDDFNVRPDATGTSVATPYNNSPKSSQNQSQRVSPNSRRVQSEKPPLPIFDYDDSSDNISIDSRGGGPPSVSRGSEQPRRRMGRRKMSDNRK